MDMEYACFCGDSFPSREALIDHNIQAHQMSEAESRKRVSEKYPAT